MDQLRPDTDDSPLRRALIWAFDWPATPYVNTTVSVDMAAALAWLEGLNAEGGQVRVTLQHLIAAAIARTLQTYPEANARIIGGRVQRYDTVGIVMAINLLGHAGGKSRELSMGVVEDVGGMSVREIASATTRQVDAEREGRATNPLVGTVFRLASVAPKPLLDGGLDLLFRAARSRSIARVLDDLIPATTFLTNPGAVIRPPPGTRVQSGGLFIPPRLAVVGTFWGISAIQEEVVPVDGVPTVRPCLPVFYFFDHRVLDGVLGGRVLRYFCELLADPASAFGSDGEQHG